MLQRWGPMQPQLEGEMRRKYSLGCSLILSLENQTLRGFVVSVNTSRLQAEHPAPTLASRRDALKGCS